MHETYLILPWPTKYHLLKCFHLIQTKFYPPFLSLVHEISYYWRKINQFIHVFLHFTIHFYLDYNNKKKMVSPCAHNLTEESK